MKNKFDDNCVITCVPLPHTRTHTKKKKEITKSDFVDTILLSNCTCNLNSFPFVADDFTEMTPPVSRRAKPDNKLSKSKKDRKTSSLKKDAESSSSSKTRRGTER